MRHSVQDDQNKACMSEGPPLVWQHSNLNVCLDADTAGCVQAVTGRLSTKAWSKGGKSV